MPWLCAGAGRGHRQPGRKLRGNRLRAAAPVGITAAALSSALGSAGGGPAPGVGHFRLVPWHRRAGLHVHKCVRLVCGATSFESCAALLLLSGPSYAHSCSGAQSFSTHKASSAACERSGANWVGPFAHHHAPRRCFCAPRLHVYVCAPAGMTPPPLQQPPRRGRDAVRRLRARTATYHGGLPGPGAEYSPSSGWSGGRTHACMHARASRAHND